MPNAAVRAAEEGLPRYLPGASADHEIGGVYFSRRDVRS